MYMHFEFDNGSNPYIATSNEKQFEMLAKYYTTQMSEQGFFCHSEREYHGRKDRETMKLVARAIAIDWQMNFDKFNYAYSELIEWQDFFRFIGKKYGLIREFQENGII